MGAIENVSLSIPRSTRFGELQRLLILRNFIEFASQIQPVLEDSSSVNREVFLLLLKDAFDLLGPDSTQMEQEAIDKLYDRYSDEVKELPGATAAKKGKVSSPKSEALNRPVVQLRRVVQVSSYCHAGFEASDQFLLQRTVYRSPQERTFHRAVQIRYPGMFALPNYPLASVANPDLLRLATSRRVYAFAMRCVLDVLLITPGEGDPIAVFELDSSFHEESEAQIRDKMKNEVLQLMRIPLFRLRVEDPTTVTADDWYAILTDQVGELPVPKRFRSREQTMSFAPYELDAENIGMSRCATVFGIFPDS